MKVVDLSIYRSRREIESLEKRVSEHAMGSKIGSVSIMKTCFKQWLKERDVANGR